MDEGFNNIILTENILEYLFLENNINSPIAIKMRKGNERVKLYFWYLDSECSD